eukprot:gene10372-10530_t
MSAAVCWVTAIAVDAADPTAACGQSITCLGVAVQELLAGTAASAANSPVSLAGQISANLVSRTSRSYLAQGLLPGLLLFLWEMMARRTWALKLHWLQERRHPAPPSTSPDLQWLGVAGLAHGHPPYSSFFQRRLVSVKLQPPADAGPLRNVVSGGTGQEGQQDGQRPTREGAGQPGQQTQPGKAMQEAYSISHLDVEELIADLLQDWPGWSLQHFQMLGPDAAADDSDDQSASASGGSAEPASAVATAGSAGAGPQLTSGFYLHPPALAVDAGGGVCLRIAPAALSQLQQSKLTRLRVVGTGQPGCTLLLDQVWQLPQQPDEEEGTAADPTSDASLLLAPFRDLGSPETAGQGASGIGSSVLGQLPLLLLPDAAALEVHALHQQLVAGGLSDGAAFQLLLPMMQDWATFLQWPDISTQAQHGGGNTSASAASNQQTQAKLWHEAGLKLYVNLAACFDDCGLTECRKLVQQQQWQRHMALVSSSGSSALPPATHERQAGEAHAASSEPGAVIHLPTASCVADVAPGGHSSSGLRLRKPGSTTSGQAAAAVKSTVIGGPDSVSRLDGADPARPQLTLDLTDDDVAAVGFGGGNWIGIVLGLPELAASCPRRKAVRFAFAIYRAEVLCKQDGLASIFFLFVGLVLLLKIVGWVLWELTWVQQPWQEQEHLLLILEQAVKMLMMVMRGGAHLLLWQAAHQISSQRSPLVSPQGLLLPPESWCTRTAQWRGLVMILSAVLQFVMCAGLAYHEFLKIAMLRAMHQYQDSLFSFLLGNIAVGAWLNHASVLDAAVHACVLLLLSFAVPNAQISGWSSLQWFGYVSCVVCSMCGVSWVLKAKMLAGFARALRQRSHQA